MIGIRCKVEGLDELAAALEQLPQDLADRALRQATAAGAALIREEAKARAPRDTGKLISATYITRDRGQSGDGNREIYHVGVRAGKRAQRIGRKRLNLDAFYWKFIEFGHFVRARGDSVRGVGRTIKRAIARTINGPPRYISGKPFLRPALESKRLDVVERIKTVLAARIKRFAAQAKKRQARTS
jgi:HK97 gp10 family phage protein